MDCDFEEALRLLLQLLREDCKSTSESTQLADVACSDQLLPPDSDRVWHSFPIVM